MNAERDREILRLREEGLGLEEIGERFGITRERARQIINSQGGVNLAVVRDARRTRQVAADDALRRRLMGIVATGLVRSLADLAVLLDVDEATVRRVGGPDLAAYLGTTRQGVVRWSAADVTAALQTAATYDWPLARGAYQQLVDLGEIHGPSVARIDQLYGWASACRMAGVESPRRIERDYQSQWTDDDIWHYARAYIEAVGPRAAFHGFDDWRRTNAPAAPSSALLRSRLGKWNDVRRTVLIEGGAMAQDAVSGLEARRLNDQLAEKMDDESRLRVWRSVLSILEHGPQRAGAGGETGLALGYVQSGKTTSITALIATAADQGYKIIVAMLGGTNLLLDQNKERLEASLGTQTRKDYRWVTEANPSGVAAAKRITDRIAGGRTVLVPVLKHAGRLNALAAVLNAVEDIENVPVLIIDDEADQASLNTSTEAESKTYESIRILRSRVPRHLYVQYTATPYAPLMLDADDLLSPNFVEFLEPGNGYTGGREFFVEFADQVIRDVPLLDEQANKTPPLELQRSLVAALGSFVAGAAILTDLQPGAAPVSMLVHSTQRNDVQERYRFLTERALKKWRSAADKAATVDDLPIEIQKERVALTERGAPDLEDSRFMEQVRWVLRETSLWLVNSTSALKKVEWNVTPVHILIGGNKLDRGFTVEGLTVTYMNRPPSSQVDTLEQRARAFGYRRDQLPFCQFFATKRTVRSLRDIVFTEYDLRAQLRDHVESGGTVHSWAREVGLLLPEGMKPTRDAVVSQLSYSGQGWYSIRLPRLDGEALAANRAIVENLGLFDAPLADYGRISLRTVDLSIRDVSELVNNWVADEYGPSWRLREVSESLERHPNQDEKVPVILMDDSGNVRQRKWDIETGFVNLFQGRDNHLGQGTGPAYPGDRQIGGIDLDPSSVVVQVHRVARRDDPTTEILTLAVHLGDRQIVRKESR
ncbi:Z1 domain-containing protein [Nocardioides sp. NPDC006303]|uniref:Z1 domain-containing protein n=1 Tax=Nocardioides sp. NPDC006303 TaxID=3156747 RepID=UPI0033B8D3D8